MRLLFLVLLAFLPFRISAQYNVDRLIMSGRVAIYYEDYVLGMRYLNQVLALKPYLYEPWQLRAIAKYNLGDYAGAEYDASKALELNPYIPLLYDLRGISRIRQDNMEGAVEDYDNAIRLEPANQNYWYNRAVCRMEMKDYEQAHLEIDSIIRRWSKFASPYLLKAEVFLQQADTLRAAEWLEKSLEVDRYNAEAWRVRASIALSKNEWESADTCFSRAIHLKPKKADNYVNRAVARLRRNNLRGAMEDYDIALDLEPNNFLAHYNRGLLRQQVGDDNRAIEDFDYVLALEPDNMMALFNRATLLDRTGNLRAAIRDYTRVIEEFPNFWTGLHYRAGCYRRLGMTAKAEMDEYRILKAQMDKHLGKQPRWSRAKLAAMRKKSEIDPNKYDQIVVDDESTEEREYKSEYRGKVQNLRIEAQYQPFICLSIFGYKNALTNYHPFDSAIDDVNGRLGAVQLTISTLSAQLTEEEIQRQCKAVDTLSVIISDIPDIATVMANVLARSVVYAIGQNYEDAIRDADACLSADSTSALAWWQRAVCNARLGDFETGHSLQTANIRFASVNADFAMAEKYAPDNAYILYSHGTFLANRRDYRQAIELLSKAIAADPHLAEAYFNRGLAYINSGDREKGVADLGRAGELGLYSAYSIIKANSKK